LTSGFNQVRWLGGAGSLKVAGVLPDRFAPGDQVPLPSRPLHVNEFARTLVKLKCDLGDVPPDLRFLARCHAGKVVGVRY